MKKAIPFTFNFLYFAGGAFYSPFIVLYYQQLEFSGWQISLLAGLPPLLTLISSPFLTNLADSTRRHKLIMSGSLFVVVISMVALPFLNFFASVMVAVLLLGFFIAPLTSLADSATMTMLVDEKENYGRVRVGGTLGWGIMALVAGAVIRTFGLNIAFWSCAIIFFLGMLISQKFSFGEYVEQKSKGNIRDLLSQPRWLIFLALAFLGGLISSATATYYSPYMKEIGADEFVIGISLLIASATEIPVFFYGDRLLKKFGAYHLLIIALLITAFRSILFAASNAPIYAILAQLLNGLTFPAMWVAGVSYADENAPQELKSTAQGLFGAMVFGIGAAVGGFIGGFLLESIGGRGLFFVYGIIVLIGVAIISFIKRRIPSNV